MQPERPPRPSARLIHNFISEILHVFQLPAPALPESPARCRRVALGAVPGNRPGLATDRLFLGELRRLLAAPGADSRPAAVHPAHAGAVHRGGPGPGRAPATVLPVDQFPGGCLGLAVLSVRLSRRADRRRHRPLPGHARGSRQAVDQWPAGARLGVVGAVAELQADDVQPGLKRAGECGPRELKPARATDGPGRQCLSGGPG
ncbi:conserved hypothetical protein [Pseudomonas protegens Pf-5]|uniref:Uncharacterized protein n=1 Tax=Pseudomonas fluorescens (strain ATCC BAA-477 / NRRL B-23932 / Pf-5) TaxID=220664 RepID=Q4KEB3_PSEF5|nr:conserved hypothetical protein [Pseudomonas protegens Pf-5]